MTIMYVGAYWREGIGADVWMDGWVEGREGGRERLGRETRGKYVICRQGLGPRSLVDVRVARGGARELSMLRGARSLRSRWAFGKGREGKEGARLVVVLIVCSVVCRGGSGSVYNTKREQGVALFASPPICCPLLSSSLTVDRQGGIGRFAIISLVVQWIFFKWPRFLSAFSKS